MNCLINFLSDEKQKSLIDMVQNRDETFECELDSYRRLFKVELNYCLDGADNDKEADKRDENFCHNEFCNHKNSCLNFYNVIRKIEEKEIDYFFNGIRMCYLYWIDSKTTLALEAFDSLMKKYGLIADCPETENEFLLKDVENRVFFRGRITDDILSKLEMFHVPFNKRHNLRNERFSLTGQPLLYLGNSIADVAEELWVNLNNEEMMKKLKISSFELISSKDKKKIFDLRCYIMQDLKNAAMPTFNKRHFFRNILSEICSFQKREELEDYAFKEAYVIPQMLAQVLKQNHYDGICYYSTKRFNGYAIQNKGTELLACERDMKYRENVVLFTHMSEDGGIDSYDDQLFKSMEISMPVAFKNIKFCLEDDLKKLKNMIEVHYRDVKARESKNAADAGGVSDRASAKRADIARNANIKAASITDFYGNVFSHININGNKYSDTKFGQIHLQLLIGILNRLLVESELLEDKSARRKAEEKGRRKGGTEEDAKLIRCNLLGQRSMGGGSCREIHDNGILHKAKVIFPYKINKEKNKAEIAVLSAKEWEELLYFQETEDNSEYERKIKKYKDWPADNAESIGSFIYQQISVVDFSDGDYSIVRNFEYVTVQMIKWDSCDDPGITWADMGRLEESYVLHYQKMTQVYRQAIPILIKKMWDMEKENEDAGCAAQM